MCICVSVYVCVWGGGGEGRMRGKGSAGHVDQADWPAKLAGSVGL